MLEDKIEDFLSAVSSKDEVNEYLKFIYKNIRDKLFWIEIRFLMLLSIFSYVVVELILFFINNVVSPLPTIFYIELLIAIFVLFLLYINLNIILFYENASNLTSSVIKNFERNGDLHVRSRILKRYFKNIRNISGLGLLEIFFSFKKHKLHNLIKNAR